MSKDFSFADQLISWQKAFGRHHLPWQKTHDPYARWLAEIMLQQTQVKTVIPYYRTFLEHYPTVAALAAAPEEEVMKLWAGLGYYSRARNLHRCAKEVMERFKGVFPQDLSELASLPGIGRSTAAAVRSAVTDEPCAILDGNVKRVLSRFFLIGENMKPPESEKILWAKAQELLPDNEGRSYAQGMMDLGATVCTRTKPSCALCPVKDGCEAFKEGRQGDFPVKKQTKPVPEERLTVGVYSDGGRVYLVKKEKGYWKGLWTLPLIDEEDEHKGEVLPLIEHRLTHLMLKIYPRKMKRLPSPIPEDWRAFQRTEIEKGALPTPLKKLLLKTL